jgi:hypothetical protein
MTNRKLGIGNLVIGIGACILCVLCVSAVNTLYAQQADSAPFNITPAGPNNLAFEVSPTTTVSGAVFNPVVTVRIRDTYNNNSTTATNSVTLAVSAGATLGGTYTDVAAESGIATFNGVTISGAAGEYTLTATSGTLTQATATFSISAYGAPTTLIWASGPASNTVAGVYMTAFTVRVADAYNNNVPGSTVSITTTVTTPVVYQAGTAVANATAVSDGSGIASFSTISMTLVGTYAFSASSSSLTTVTSTGFDITPGASNTLAFTVQPVNTVAGVSISPAVVVTAYDRYNNVVPGVSVAITMTPIPPADNTTTTLTVTSSPQITDANGTATFSDAQITLVNTGYRLRATGTGGP